MRLIWTELNLNAPQASLAGRGDGPATSYGEGLGGAVSFASNWANESTLNLRIARELNALSKRAELYFRPVPPGDRRRLLTEVWVAVRRIDAIVGRTYLGLTMHRLTDNPLQAIRQIRHTTAVGPGPTASSDHRESRWFLCERR